MAADLLLEIVCTKDGFQRGEFELQKKRTIHKHCSKISLRSNHIRRLLNLLSQDFYSRSDSLTFIAGYSTSL